MEPFEILGEYELPVVRVNRGAACPQPPGRGWLPRSACATPARAAEWRLRARPRSDPARNPAAADGDLSPEAAAPHPGMLSSMSRVRGRVSHVAHRS